MKPESSVNKIKYLSSDKIQKRTDLTMAANKSVTVLTPNGRRPTVKVSPNMTILQILEEVCQKYEFNPDEYDLKHHNAILDVNSIFRYANISNNACLEMVKCKNPRKVSNVTICVQLENGNRLTGEFPANVNIEKILGDLGVEYNIESAVLIFTQREIYGKEFGATTLKSLGLGSGKALFRLLQRDPEKLKEQAHVYNVPSKPKVPKTEECEDTKPKRAPLVDPKSKALDPLSILKSERQKPEPPSVEVKQKECNSKIAEITKPVSNDKSNKTTQKKDETPMEVDGDASCSVPTEEIIEEPKVEYLGERGALLFNQAGSKTFHQADIPDNFFELTMNDAKALLRDVKKMQSTFEDAPLLTAAQRELERDKARLSRLHKYQQAIIRIQFPSQLVLQGHFGPLENVQAIKDFVRKYLENPESDFTLYTAPPRCDLSVDMSLLDQDLVPSAIIHYSGSSDLKLDIKSKLTDPAAASIQAIKTRLTTTRKDTASMIDDSDDAVPSTSASTAKAANTNSNVTEPPVAPSRPQIQQTKAPKWFKLSSK